MNVIADVVAGGAASDRERARYDSQVVFVDRSEVVDRMRRLAVAHEVSLARVLRDVVRAGLPEVEAAYAAAGARLAVDP